MCVCLLIHASTAPDPLSMAPFLPGDFVTFQGIRRGNEFICFSIIAENVQILTLGDMVYVRMELGLLGISNFNPNAELAESRVRIYIHTHAWNPSWLHAHIYAVSAW